MKKKKDNNNDNRRRARKIPELTDVKIALTGVINIDFTAEEFFDYYDAIGWTFGNKFIRNWEAILRQWIRKPRKKTIRMKITTESSYWEDIEKQERLRNERLAEQKAKSITYEEYQRMKREGRL